MALFSEPMVSAFSLVSKVQAFALALRAVLSIFASPTNARKIIKLITVIITN